MRTSWDCSLHQFDLARPPGLIEPRLERAVEAQDGEPALARRGLHPVAFLARWRFRSEVDVHRAIGVGFHRARVAGQGGVALVGLQDRAGLCVFR